MSSRCYFYDHPPALAMGQSSAVAVGTFNPRPSGWFFISGTWAPSPVRRIKWLISFRLSLERWELGVGEGD